MAGQEKTLNRQIRDFVGATALVAGSAIATSLVTGSTYAQAAGASGQATQIIRDWPDTSKKAAKAMMEKYGQPDESTETMLIWHNNGPWVRTIVYGHEIDHDFPMPHKDVLEQFVHYDVPPDLFDDLAHYDGSVIAERTKGELSARCDKEAANFLALNLAHDVVEGEKSVDEARQAYADAMKQMMAGNPPETTKRLTFEPAGSDVTNSDQALLKQ